MANQNFFLNQYKKNNNIQNLNNNTDFSKETPKKEVKKFTFKKIEEVLEKEQNKQSIKTDSIGVLSKKKLAAILLLISNDEKSSKILKSFNEEEIIKISLEILKIDQVTADDIKQVEKNFGPQNITDLTNIKGSKEFLRFLLQKTFGIKYGSQLFLNILEKADDKNFSFLENIPTEKVFEIIKNESPLINALIISKMQPQKASEVLKKFSPEEMSKIIKNIASQSEINNDALDIIAKKIKEKTNEVINNDKNVIKISGKEKLIEILKHTNIDDAQAIIENLEQDNPELADDIKENIFVFNDVVKMKKEDLEFALKDYPNSDIAFMLKGTSPEIRTVFFTCVSKHRAVLIVDEMKVLGEVKKSDVLLKQHDFVNFLKDLELSGSISLQEDTEEYVN